MPRPRISRLPMAIGLVLMNLVGTSTLLVATNAIDAIWSDQEVRHLKRARKRWDWRLAKTQLKKAKDYFQPKIGSVASAATSIGHVGAPVTSATDQSLMTLRNERDSEEGSTNVKMSNTNDTIRTVMNTTTLDEKRKSFEPELEAAGEEEEPEMAAAATPQSRHHGAKVARQWLLQRHLLLKTMLGKLMTTKRKRRRTMMTLASMTCGVTTRMGAMTKLKSIRKKVMIARMEQVLRRHLRIMEVAAGEETTADQGRYPETAVKAHVTAGKGRRAGAAKGGPGLHPGQVPDREAVVEEEAAEDGRAGDVGVDRIHPGAQGRQGQDHDQGHGKGTRVEAAAAGKEEKAAVIAKNRLLLAVTTVVIAVGERRNEADAAGVPGARLTQVAAQGLIRRGRGLDQGRAAGANPGIDPPPQDGCFGHQTALAFSARTPRCYDCYYTLMSPKMPSAVKIKYYYMERINCMHIVQCFVVLNTDFQNSRQRGCCL